MVKVIGILLVIVVVLIDVPTMWKNKQKKELIVYSVLLSIGVTLLILLAVGIKIPSPVDLFTIMEKSFENIFK